MNSDREQADSMPPDKCDLARIEALLNDDPTAINDQQLHQHLEYCQACQLHLEELAANPGAWQETAAMLSSAENDDDDNLTFAPITAQTSGMVSNQILRLLTPSPTADSLGTLKNYEIESVIGVGGMGVVLKAHDPALNRAVAIKVLAPQLVLSESARIRFTREAQAVAGINHRNVIAIHQVDEFKKLPYIVMPFVQGESLQDRLNRQGALPVEQIVQIASQVTAGLAAAHEKGLIHRDIKPANILMEPEQNQAVLTDFGLARAVDDISLTRQGTIAGTPQFMSPEQTSGQLVDQRSDLFSLGSVIYAMCTGQPPFDAGSSLAVMRLINDEAAQPIPGLNPKIPDWLCQIVSKLMAKSADQRFESAANLHETLQQCAAHLQQPASTPLPTALTRKATSTKSIATRTNFVVASVVALAGILVVAWMINGWDDQTALSSGSETPGQLEKLGSSDGTSETERPNATSENNSNGDSQQKATPDPTLGIGDIAPKIEIAGNINPGSTLALTSGDRGSGQAHLLHFWSSEDPRAFYAMGKWSRLHRLFPNLQTAIICVDESESQASEFLGKVKSRLGQITFPVAMDSNQVTQRNWLTATGQTETPVSCLVNQSGQLIWVGIPENLESILAKINSSEFDVTKAQAFAIEEARVKSEFATLLENRDWEESSKLLPRIRKLDPTLASELDLANFKLRLSDHDKTTAIAVAETIFDNYPGQPYLLRNVSERLTREVFETTFETGSIPAQLHETALKLAKKSVSLTLDSDPTCLAALAKAYDSVGDIDEAIRVQALAVQHAGTMRDQMVTVLREYEQSQRAKQ